MSEYNLADLIQLALKNENFLKYDIEVQGKTGKGDGYMGEITFVTVTGDTKTEERRILNLVVKTSTQVSLLRQQIPIKKLFEKEIYIYDEVVPAFRQLHERTESKNLLPKCYLTKILENGEVLVLEDLKSRGYNLWDRKIPMDFDHVRLVLEAFGKWHALSLVMRRTQPEKFRELVKKNNTNMWSHHCEYAKLFGVLCQFFERVRSAWKDEPEVAETKFSESEIRTIFLEKVREDPDQHVIMHGDSWTNNFMFKTVDGNPMDIYIIDFQLSGVASPVLDLSVFIYSCVDTKKHPDVKELLQIYHDSVSQSLALYNCDPAEIFSFDKLLYHWKKFSCYGIVLGTFLLKFSHVESHEAPDLSGTAGTGKFADKLNFEIASAETYHNRAKDNILHYVRNL